MAGFGLDTFQALFYALVSNLTTVFRFETKNSLLPRCFSEGCVRSGAPAGSGQFSRARIPAPGGSKRYALRPLAAKRPVAAAFLFFFLTLRSLIRVSGCQGLEGA